MSAPYVVPTPNAMPSGLRRSAVHEGKEEKHRVSVPIRHRVRRWTRRRRVTPLDQCPAVVGRFVPVGV